MTAPADLAHMHRALLLARRQHGRTGKNPAVGCVILGADGTKLAEAATGDGGTAHAEELALASLPPGAAKGGTAYVTLEPCRERSAGGPSCSERLAQAGIARLVCAVADRHPNGAGGFARLEAAGLDMVIGFCADEAAPLYEDFFRHL